MDSNHVLNVKKIKKNQFYSSDSKTWNLTVSEYIYNISSYSIFIERFRLKQKSGLIENAKGFYCFMHFCKVYYKTAC